MVGLPKSSEVVLELVLDEGNRRSEGGENIEPLGHPLLHLLTRLQRGKAQK